MQLYLYNHFRSFHQASIYRCAILTVPHPDTNFIITSAAITLSSLLPSILEVLQGIIDTFVHRHNIIDVQSHFK